MADRLLVECRNCGVVQALDPTAFPLCESCGTSDLTHRLQL